MMVSARLFFVVLLFLISPGFAEEKEVPKVIVPIAPYAFVVESLTDGQVLPYILVPSNASVHTFEPTQKQVMEASKADIWLTLNEPFEQRIQKSFSEHNPEMHIVDLTEGIDMLFDHNEKDPHIWLSPKLMQKQVATIKDALIAKYPDLEPTIASHYTTLIEKLEELDKQVSTMLKDVSEYTFFVSHPAFGYFCQEYAFKQVALEVHGKEPSPKKLTELIDKAKEAKISTLFVLLQHPSKAADVIAEKLGLTLITLNPLEKDYFQNITTIAEAIKNSSEAAHDASH